MEGFGGIRNSLKVQARKPPKKRVVVDWFWYLPEAWFKTTTPDISAGRCPYANSWLSMSAKRECGICKYDTFYTDERHRKCATNRKIATIRLLLDRHLRLI